MKHLLIGLSLFISTIAFAETSKPQCDGITVYSHVDLSTSAKSVLSSVMEYKGYGEVKFFENNESTPVMDGSRILFIEATLTNSSALGLTVKKSLDVKLKLGTKFKEILVNAKTIKNFKIIEGINLQAISPNYTALQSLYEKSSKKIEKIMLEEKFPNCK